MIYLLLLFSFFGLIVAIPILTIELVTKNNSSDSNNHDYRSHYYYDDDNWVILPVGNKQAIYTRIK